MAYRRTEARLEHAETVRQSIMDAAVELIRSEGIAALTVRRVVERAGSSVGNYYHHFSDKDSLLVALVDRFADRVAAHVDRAATEATDDRERLRSMVFAGVKSALDETTLSRLVFASTHGDRVRGRIRTLFIDRTAIFFTNHPVGVATSLDPALVAAMWQGAILLLLERVAAGEVTVEPEEAARACADWNVRALGLGAPHDQW